MKILHTVESYYPSVSGMVEVVKQISEELVAMGHSVTVATSKNRNRKAKQINGVKIRSFNISGKMVTSINGNEDQCREFFLNSDFDVITNFAAQQWATDLMLPILSRINAKKVFVPTGFSGLYQSIYKVYFEKMKKWINQYDMNVFLSDNYRDIDFARRNKTPEHKMMIIPNGASKKEFLAPSKINIRQHLNIPNNHKIILHVGSHTGLKGHGELIKIFNRAKIEDVTLLIVGNLKKKGCADKCRKQVFWSKLKQKASLRQDNKNIVLAELDRETIIAAYHSANLFLFPSNIECSPIVLFEALASKTPFLSTNVGNAKEIVKWTRGGIILPTEKNNAGYSYARIKESSQMLKQLLENTDLLHQLSGDGFGSWKKRFTWEKIAKQYENLYLNLLKS